MYLLSWVPTACRCWSLSEGVMEGKWSTSLVNYCLSTLVLYFYGCRRAPHDVDRLCPDACGALPDYVMGNGARHSNGNGARPRSNVPVLEEYDLIRRMSKRPKWRSGASVTGTTPIQEPAAVSSHCRASRIIFTSISMSYSQRAVLNHLIYNICTFVVFIFVLSAKTGLILAPSRSGLSLTCSLYLHSACPCVER